MNNEDGMMTQCVALRYCAPASISASTQCVSHSFLLHLNWQQESRGIEGMSTTPHHKTNLVSQSK